MERIRTEKVEAQHKTGKMRITKSADNKAKEITNENKLRLFTV